ncbi:hypothetical protein CRUP_005553 [Coryphaenoides rupestris]|nr:hypothetical protein CRUP_005553 [Coryphaenoides rupestris]
MGALSQLCKVILGIFNALYCIVGMAFVLVGVWLRVRGSDITDAALVNGEYALIGVGTVMIVTAVVGDIGGCCDKTATLSVYCVLLVCLIAGQITLYAKQKEVGQPLAQFYVLLYAIYIASSDLVVGGTLGVVHYTMNCCGALGVVGLDPTSHTCPKKTGFLDRFMSPCPPVLLDVFSAKPPVAMGIFYGNAALLILCLLCSVALHRMLKKAGPHYIHLTQSVLSLSTPLAEPQLQLYPHHTDGSLDTMVLTSTLAEA